MKRSERAILWLALVLWLGLNLLFLTRYPLMHSDESWLAGLSRSMMAGEGIGVTESFFDLKPRWPHAIKVLFQLLLMPFLRAFGHTLFAVRLPSVLCGTLALYMAFRMARSRLDFWSAMAVMGLLGLNNQFIAISHTARQEIYLLTLLMGCLWVLTTLKPSLRRSVLLGVLTGAAVGFHPNSFLLACGTGLTMLCEMMQARRFRWKEMLGYMAVTATLAGVFVLVSFWLDPQFPTHYRMYGENEFDLFQPAGERLREAGIYLAKLWTGSSATYHVPDLRAGLGLGVGCALLAFFLTARRGDGVAFWALPLGAFLGTMVIGRYNQLSSALWLLPMLLAITVPLSAWPRLRRTLPGILAVWIAISGMAIARTLPFSYEAYLRQIADYVESEETTLGNLNTALYFEEDAFFDVRNLSYLKETDLSFAEYIERNGIRYILWPDEMAMIYEKRPTWNILYGNPRYVPEAERFFAEHCEKLGEIQNRAFAARLVRELGSEHTITVYQVK